MPLPDQFNLLFWKLNKTGQNTETDIGASNTFEIELCIHRNKLTMS